MPARLGADICSAIATALIAPFIFLHPAVAADASKFDLICTGTLSELYGPKPRAKKEPFKNLLKVDLEKMEYCPAGCEKGQTINKIKEVLSDRIVFSDSDQHWPGIELVTKMSVNRTDGTYMADIETVGVLHLRFEGQCQKAPFSGFPKTKF